MAHRAFVNQIVQVGAEASPGAGGSANRLLDNLVWTFGSKPTTKQFNASGRKNFSTSALVAEMAQGKVSGQADYQTLIYQASSVFGKTAPTAHVGSTIAQDWVFTPPLAGAGNPQTYLAQQGDANDAEQYAYLLFSGFGYSFSRTAEVQTSGDWFSQTFTDGVSLTASPTAIALAPMVGSQFTIFLDGSSANIGQTPLLNPLKVDFAASNYYGQFWPVNRTNASYASHLDLLPKNELKITLEADATAIGFIQTYLRTGAKAYLRVDGVGPLCDASKSIPFGMTHDLCCFLTSVSDFNDTDGAFAYELTFATAEDLTWNLAQRLTLTNLLTAL